MKISQLLSLVILLCSSAAIGQVGIQNTDPKASLDITATNPAAPANTDGLLIPRLDAFPATDPGADQDGMLIFMTTDDIFYYWENTSMTWIPLVSQNQNNHYVGELYGGGIVFYVYEFGNHGLIASLDDLDGGAGVDWGLDGTDVTGATSVWDGSSNTAAVIAAGGAATDAAGLCNAYSNDGFGDWYLPSILELKLFDESAWIVSKILESDGDSSTNTIDTEEKYWTSTQFSSAKVLEYNWQNGHTEKKNKTETYRVRAIRAF